MILQRLVFERQLEKTEELYYKVKHGRARFAEGSCGHVDLSGSDVMDGGKGSSGMQAMNGVMFPAGIELDLRTYFNAFSAAKWKKHTKVSNVGVALEYRGNMKLAVVHFCGTDEKCLYTCDLKSEERTVHRTPDFPLPSEGMIGLVLTAKEGEACVYGGAYETQDALTARDVCIGISICTYRREAFVERNMKSLKKSILDNEKSPAYGKVTICISDNAGTLDGKRMAHENVKIVKNKNLGGVGGFTRGMLEHMESDEELTHVLLMDDDVVIPPSAIERLYVYLTLLKPKYFEYMLGGALMRLDAPWIQYESGALWNDGDMIANHHNQDMRDLSYCLANEEESRQDYVGWSFACIPVSFIKVKKLPFPVFLHRDDIEYGLRAHGRFLFLNGICVWHEPFETKCPGVTEYYDVRNLAILNAVHEPEFSALDFKKMLFKQISSNIGKFRYQYVDLNLCGAVDFLRGFKWFYEQDAQEIHKKLAKYNYKMVAKEHFVGHGGLTVEDLNVEGEEKPPKMGKLRRLFIIGTTNGHFLPAKNGKPKVTIPYPNIYTLFRCREVIYVDGQGLAFLATRSIKEMICSYVKFFRVCRLIDKHYDKVCADYRKFYERLTRRGYWERYLELEANKEDGPKEDEEG